MIDQTKIRLSHILSDIGFSNKEIHKKTASEFYSAKEVQTALLENLTIPGYFTKEELWKIIYLMDVNWRSGDFSDQWKINNRVAFRGFSTKLEKAKIITDLLHDFSDEEFCDRQDAEDLLLAISQTAFGRSQHQERNELTTHFWMEDENLKKSYLKNARILGLIDEKMPILSSYDESWIMGASRAAMINRIQYLKKMRDEYAVDLGKIRLLTGQRELWAEIDSLTTLEESKHYLLGLAHKYDIKINESQPFCDRFEGRTYLRYAAGETKKLTETILAKEIFFEIFGYEIDEVVDSKPADGRMRPTTLTAAFDAANGAFGDRIKSGSFPLSKRINIAIISNQPYCDRQAITNCVGVLMVLKNNLKNEIVFEGVGDKSHCGIAQIHSEFGALINKAFTLYNLKNDVELWYRKRPQENLIYSTRCNEINIPKFDD